MEMIKLENINKSFNGKVQYKNFNLDIVEGKITVILGESGAGKTTLLKMIANLVEFDGKIYFSDRKIENEDLSIVFQEDRLIKNLTVAENLRLIDKNCDVKAHLNKFNLLDKENEYIKNLSGGEKRRIAIIRALMLNRKILLLDEPLNSLDLKNKREIIEMIKEKNKRENNTVITVTHDITEAVSLADRIIVLKKGEIVFDEKKITEKTQSELYQVLST